MFTKGHFQDDARMPAYENSLEMEMVERHTPCLGTGLDRQTDLICIVPSMLGEISWRCSHGDRSQRCRPSAAPKRLGAVDGCRSPPYLPLHCT